MKIAVNLFLHAAAAAGGQINKSVCLVEDQTSKRCIQQGNYSSAFLVYLLSDKQDKAAKLV